MACSKTSSTRTEDAFHAFNDELLEDISQVLVNGLFGHAKYHYDAGIARTPGHRQQDFSFPKGQS
jgi:hypothetical protein